MKTILLTMAAGLLSCSVFGQGGVVINTRATGVLAPATNILTGQPASGNTYLAQLFYAPAGTTDESQFQPMLSAPGGAVAAPSWFGTGGNAGYILTSTGGGNRFVDTAVVPAGALTAFQLRAWEAALGSTWNEALTSWRNGPMGPVLGKSAIITVVTSADATQTPRFLSPLQAYTLVPVPEPGVMVLAGLGLLGLLIRRRK